jgi:hypothetical protein
MRSSLQTCPGEVDWASHQPLVLLCLRVAPKEDTAIFLAERVYGSPLTLPGQFLEASTHPQKSLSSSCRGLFKCLVFPHSSLQRILHPRFPKASCRSPTSTSGGTDTSLHWLSYTKSLLQMGHKVMTVSIASLKPYLGMASLQAMDPPL